MENKKPKVRLRSINVHFWDDSYVIKLKPKEKLLFLYLLTNPLCNLIGIYEITLNRICFDTGLRSSEVSAILLKFQKDDRIIFDSGYVVLLNFLKNQSFNSNMLKGAHSLFVTLPNPLQTVLMHSKHFNLFFSDILTLRKSESESESESERNMKVKVNDIPDLCDVVTEFKSRGYDEAEANRFFGFNQNRKWLVQGVGEPWKDLVDKWIFQKLNKVNFKNYSYGK